MDEYESPFARVPAPGTYEQPSALTVEGEIAAYGQMAGGLKGSSLPVRIGLLVLVLIPVVAGVLGILLWR